MQRLADEGDAQRGRMAQQRVRLDQRAYPLRAGQRLAGAAATEHQPCAPSRHVIGRGLGERDRSKLLLPRPRLPVVRQPFHLLGRKLSYRLARELIAL